MMEPHTVAADPVAELARKMFNGALLLQFPVVSFFYRHLAQLLGTALYAF
jgi:hypothetical protein